MRPHVVHWLEAVLPGSVASALAPTWFTCVGLAGVVALFAMLSLARRHRLDAGAVASIVLWCYVAAVAAGVVVPAAIDAVEQLCTSGRVRLRWAGMTSFWGYLAGGWVVVAMCRSRVKSCSMPSISWSVSGITFKSSTLNRPARRPSSISWAS